VCRGQQVAISWAIFFGIIPSITTVTIIITNELDAVLIWFIRFKLRSIP
jgi:hypothetical protein